MVYRRPGPQSEELSLGGFVTIPGGVQTVGVVAPGSNYIIVTDDPVTRGTGTTDTLPDTVSGDLYEMIRIGSLPGLSDYTAGTDYGTVDNAVKWIPSQGPDAAATYYVTYKKAKPTSYYDVQTHYDIDDARDIHGYEMVNGAINPLTLAIKTAIEAGASQVIAAQQTGTSYSNFTAAVDKLKKEDIDILLVPGITAGDTFLTYAIAHANEMSSKLEGRERILVVGPTLSNLSVTQLKAAVPTDNELDSFMAPPQVKMIIHDYDTEEDETKWVSTQYAAASLAGVMADPSYDVAEPMLRKSLPGIVGITNYLRSEADSLATDGIMVLEQKGSVVQVRHDLTTYVGNSAKEQVSVVRIKHYVQKNWRTILEDRYVGKKNTAEARNGMLGTSSDYLSQLMRDPKILNGFRNLRVEQDEDEARKVNVFAEVSPIFPIIWIDISYSIYVQ